MALTVQDGSLVVRDGKLGTGQGCCCGGPCPPGRVCGEECCPEGQTCVNGECGPCPPERVCGETCCPEGQTCVDGQCVAVTGACCSKCFARLYVEVASDDGTTCPAPPPPPAGYVTGGTSCWERSEDFIVRLATYTRAIEPGDVLYENLCGGGGSDPDAWQNEYSAAFAEIEANLAPGTAFFFIAPSWEPGGCIDGLTQSQCEAGGQVNVGGQSYVVYDGTFHAGKACAEEPCCTPDTEPCIYPVGPCGEDGSCPAGSVCNEVGICIAFGNFPVGECPGAVIGPVVPGTCGEENPLP